ncbi:ABC-type Fe3+-hydroxamate transport system substrate-binding protein [Ulvibacter sp. MAR_2010_11]|uniref:ABC transporter substrate-binding protein n=1 Tax=Ulvibacter sp. MAR_2010_11 TaxID=1250229 RepID=UPI000C2C8957|nr:helical backbone metal receptor [Ulvibacter sp. MAR_2010_11]PKA82210.1 ABC-type Fe3+-hydroxamate transport system substrate-binding protein [Ulvibacter sp. MAR_2010_11]
MQIKDQLNRTLTFSKTPKRIVSLVPSQTELLVDLGLKPNLVGITKFCVHPETLRKEITVVGGTKQVHFDKIEALQPDVIICNKEENTEEIVSTLEKIAPVWVSDIITIEDSLEMITRLGTIFNVQKTALELVAEIVAAQEDFLKFMILKPSKKAVYIIWKNPYMAAGQSTFINCLLALNNFENCAIEFSSRYPEIPPNFLKEADIVLLSSEPYPFKEEDVFELQKQLNVEVRLVDGEYFSWYGSRLKNAFAYFKTLH